MFLLDITTKFNKYLDKYTQDWSYEDRLAVKADPRKPLIMENACKQIAMVDAKYGRDGDQTARNECIEWMAKSYADQSIARYKDALKSKAEKQRERLEETKKEDLEAWVEENVTIVDNSKEL